MVQRITVVPPTVTPVTVVVAKLISVMEPGPLILVHVPVPGVAALPARVNVVVLSQWFWSDPAAAAGALFNVISSKLLHSPFTMVQRSTRVDPTGTPVTVEVSEFADVMVPVPVTMVHVPVPGAAALPARVNVVELSQWFWSVPAAAAGALYKVTSS